jgi:4-amino-4-deoxy-L-arabinose transferase-like glycosyltransferase
MNFSHRTGLFFLIGILIIAGFFRLHYLTAYPPGLYPDEAMNGSNALEAIRTGEYKIFYPENNGREGLFINIQAMFLRFTGIREPWMLRLPSALFGIATVLGVYFLARELFGRNAALWSSFFTATSFWHILFSRIGFRAITAPFWFVWGTYLVIRSYRALTLERMRVRDFFLSVFAGAVFGAGFHSYIAYRIMPLVVAFIALYFLVHAVRERRIGAWLATSAGIGIGFVIAISPLLLYFYQNPQDFLGRTSQVSVFSSASPAYDLSLNILKTVGMFFVYGDGNWRHNLSGRPELFLPVALLFALGIVLVIRLMAQMLFSRSSGTGSPGFAAWVTFLSLAFASLPVVISNEGIPHALRAILMIPSVMIIAGFAAETLRTAVAARLGVWGRPVLALVIAGLILEPFHTYFIRWGPNPETANSFAQNYVIMGRELRELPDSTAKFVVVHAGGTLVRDIPMPTQTIMFMTDTFGLEQQMRHNLFYLQPEARAHIPEGSVVFDLH